MTAQTELVGHARPLYQRPVLATLLVVVLYLITEIISESAARSLTGTSHGARVLVKLGLFAIFAFIVIPQLLGLPRGRLSSTEYLQVIGLRIGSPSIAFSSSRFLLLPVRAQPATWIATLLLDAPG